MRPITILSLAAAVLGLGLATSEPAKAGGDDTYGYGTVYVHHHVYAPNRYKHLYHYHQGGPRHIHVVNGGYDPHAWSYKTRGYYPYYGSSYWVPAPYMKNRWRYAYYGPKYSYYPAWSYPAYPAPRYYKRARTW
jgi:hypothetical protein